ncbi:hypothetical protein Afer_1436 [Acidimicrobium ferrooxidans DSM 10331]|uniref:Uncharacterized protein n=1 Tax=Acidimicrobium ferrooxidans (strain DSM 10331 / JCM 15462 / NBRC 103882 / ICP) TaxID=525909 RepID=C7M052_ACIFD|nr:hypothetical protein Afer_1436 [Acidimicrobium ferrooxidans DSM 10331]
MRPPRVRRAAPITSIASSHRACAARATSPSSASSRLRCDCEAARSLAASDVGEAGRFRVGADHADGHHVLAILAPWAIAGRRRPGVRCRWIVLGIVAESRSAPSCKAQRPEPTVALSRRVGHRSLRTLPLRVELLALAAEADLLLAVGGLEPTVRPCVMCSADPAPRVCPRAEPTGGIGTARGWSRTSAATSATELVGAAARRRRAEPLPRSGSSSVTPSFRAQYVSTRQRNGGEASAL